MKTLLALITLTTAVLLPARAGNVPQAVKPTQILRGSVEDEKIGAQIQEVITTQKEWKHLDDLLQMKGALPEVDFTKNLVITATTAGSSMNISIRLDDAGDLKIAAMATRDMRPGKRWILAIVPRTGVKSVEGRPIAVAVPDSK